MRSYISERKRNIHAVFGGFQNFKYLFGNLLSHFLSILNKCLSLSHPSSDLISCQFNSQLNKVDIHVSEYNSGVRRVNIAMDAKLWNILEFPNIQLIMLSAVETLEKAQGMRSNN